MPGATPTVGNIIFSLPPSVEQQPVSGSIGRDRAKSELLLTGIFTNNRSRLEIFYYVIWAGYL
jgi:hypothetical protein